MIGLRTWKRHAIGRTTHYFHGRVPDCGLPLNNRNVVDDVRLSVAVQNSKCVVGRNNRLRFDRDFKATMACTSPKRVCIVGSGNWGSAIAKIVGSNAARLATFDDRVTMYVYEELINGKKLTEIINETQENVKYLPGHKLPSNVVAVPDVLDAARDADILIFVVPHQFIRTLCSTLLGKIKPTAIALSLIKGFDRAEGGGIDLISHIITRLLKIPCSVLMGANLAGEVADEKFCETTIGCKDATVGPVLRDLIQTTYFRVVVVDDEDTVEVCGALKNIVACGAGFVDGLDLGDNTKAAVIRLGLMEMVKFVDVFYPGGKLSTFFESCGVADLITTCYGGRNRKVSEAFVRTGKSIKELEDEMLNGQKLQGPYTAEEVNYMLKNKGMEDKFPLFTAIHRICMGQLTAQDFIDCIRNHPEHMVKQNQSG
ncbi:glycerol-3-phosphate dehydrogenase [NAD(+)], cytoplasmic isoform X2 [Cylas formicarius]|uniref:glycerol-3-phosphate dehydrogenase [NAD(+)], cytoplasmic isoform X2 n=1 Tax=Cylas formicarius TaxID=197179 RepID=UPI00295854F2|nr:glycerol-3-phosphate dehydrogenase [NAD(+)], cytoplasmic isoform X2 [Cylas formicarius]